jgi:uncharacterized protein YkwD
MPATFRKSLTVVLTVGALAALAAPAGAFTTRRAHETRRAHQTGHVAATSALESQTLSQLNAIRAHHGLKPLHLSLRLTAAASAHSRQMVARGYFAHESAGGGAFWRRIQHFYGSQGYHYWSVGENLLWSSPNVDAGGAVQMWMNSPEHRANILNGDWREIGLSALHVPSAPGVYGGHEVTVFTTDFGARR